MASWPSEDPGHPPDSPASCLPSALPTPLPMLVGGIPMGQAPKPLTYMIQLSHHDPLKRSYPDPSLQMRKLGLREESSCSRTKIYSRAQSKLRTLCLHS